jgi:DNA-binding transcriptional MerR regulator
MRRRRLPEKLYRIGEVIDHTGLSRQTLHFYATIGLISEERRTRSGYRLFPPSVFATLERVRRLQKRGYTLREIREILERTHAHATRPKAAKTARTDQTDRKPEPKKEGT